MLSAIALGVLSWSARRLPHDYPSNRSLHDRPVSRVGGIAIWAGFLPAALLAAGPVAGNLAWLAPLALGEAWHNNHHAFPGSARLGLERGQSDPGWWVLTALAQLGLVWDVKTPDALPRRPNLVPLRS